MRKTIMITQKTTCQIRSAIALGALAISFSSLAASPTPYLRDCLAEAGHGDDPGNNKRTHIHTQDIKSGPAVYLCQMAYIKESERGPVSPEAMYRLARALLAEGVSQDVSRALELLNDSGSLGFPLAQETLGYLYMTGDNVEKNPILSEEWMLMAAKNGRSSAQYNMGIIYMNGLGTEKDEKAAIEWYKKSANLGNTLAQHELAIALSSGIGTPVDVEQSRHWLRRAAEGGNVRSQVMLGDAFRTGQGVTTDHREAAKWYELAARQGDPNAQFHLGRAYLDGKGVTRDDKKAAEFLHLSGNQENPEAQFLLAHLYETGRGVTQDIRNTNIWLDRAASNGHPSAQSTLGRAYEHGIGRTRNLTKAKEWYGKAAAQGDHQSMERLEALSSPAPELSGAEIIAGIIGLAIMAELLRNNESPRSASGYSSPYDCGPGRVYSYSAGVCTTPGMSMGYDMWSSGALD